MRNRVFILALIALAVPFPALALTDGPGGPSPSASLSVSTSLDHCGLAATQIVCKIDAGWNSVPGAEDYSLTATSADGSVVDMGRTSGQSSSVWIPYAGPGVYSVQVTAWGTPPGEEDDGKPEVIARSSSLSNAGATAPGAAQSGSASNGPSSDGDEPVDEGPVDEDPVTTEPVEEPPVCDPVPPVEEPPAPTTPPAETGDGDAPSDASVIDDPQDGAGTIPVDDDCNG